MVLWIVDMSRVPYVHTTHTYSLQAAWMSAYPNTKSTGGLYLIVNVPRASATG